MSDVENYSNDEKYSDDEISEYDFIVSNKKTKQIGNNKINIIDNADVDDADVDIDDADVDIDDADVDIDDADVDIDDADADVDKNDEDDEDDEEDDMDGGGDDSDEDANDKDDNEKHNSKKDKNKNVNRITTNPIIIDDDDDDDDDDVYLQKFNQELNNTYINQFHPECLIHNSDEIDKLSRVIRDNNNIIVDPLHKTNPYLTKYERTRILGQRAKQLETGANPFVRVPENIIDCLIIAELELKEKKIPFIIKRPIPGGAFEYWKLKDLEIIHY